MASLMLPVDFIRYRAMRNKLSVILMASMLLFVALALQACVESRDPYWGPTRQAHEEREWLYGPRHMVCDSFGRNCMVCDADNDYCRRPALF